MSELLHMPVQISHAESGPCPDLASPKHALRA